MEHLGSAKWLQIFERFNSSTWKRLKNTDVEGNTNSKDLEILVGPEDNLCLLLKAKKNIVSGSKQARFWRDQR